MRTAVSTLFTFCPPLPPERNVSHLKFIRRDGEFGIVFLDFGNHVPLAKLVCRRLLESNGEMRTSRWTPRSALAKP